MVSWTTGDRRGGWVVHVALTDAGRALIDKARPDHIDTENRVLTALNQAERSRLAHTLRNLPESLGDTG